MKWFKGITNLFELKKEYKKLAMIYHPDRGGDLVKMQEINGEYDKVFPLIQTRENEEIKQHNEKTTDWKNKKHVNSEMPNLYREFIYRIIHLEGIQIELCGTWIWISGNTKEHRKYLKEVGCFWADKKQMWYWRSEEYRSFSRKSHNIKDIRNKYGSDIIHNETTYQLHGPEGR